jgi:hypothetical protein
MHRLREDLDCCSELSTTIHDLLGIPPTPHRLYHYLQTRLALLMLMLELFEDGPGRQARRGISIPRPKLMARVVTVRPRRRREAVPLTLDNNGTTRSNHGVSIRPLF